MTHRLPEPVAIVGMSVLLPKADSIDAYWHNLVNGVDAISETPPNRWDPELYDPEQADNPNRFYCRRGGFVDELAYFDPMQFGVMPASVPATEPEQLLALRVAHAAIEDAGGLDRLEDRDRAAVILGRLGLSTTVGMSFNAHVQTSDMVSGFIRELLPELPEDRIDRIRRKVKEKLGTFQPEDVIGLMPNLSASRVANRLDLHGPAYVLDAACASSLVAVEHGVTGLLNGRLDVAVVGGVHHNHDATFWSVFSQLKALSHREEIRPFDTMADGLLIGEGTAMVVLKRQSDAIRDGDRIYAVIRGIGVSSDGRVSSLVNPEATGQMLAVRRAWASAGLDPAAPDSIGMLEAHGTATPVGDAVELATVAEAFGPPRESSSPVIGSVKSMIGHTMSTAGAAALIKAVLAVSRGMLLPTLHCDNPRPEMANTRFTPASTARPWNGPGPRRAAVNAFGFGGINAHVIIEEAPEPPRARRRARAEPATPGEPAASAVVHEPDQIVLLEAPDRAALARLLDADDQVIRAHGTARATEGADRAYAGGCRLGIADPAPERLAAARKVVAAGAAWRGGRDIWFSPRPMLADGEGRIAFVFPGLEAELSHSVNDVITHFGLETTEAEADEFSGRFIEIMRLGYLMYEALGRIGVTPDAVAGHSLGEWMAGLVAGLVPELADESKLGEAAAIFFDPAHERHDLLHAVIGTSADAVEARLPGYPGVVLTHDNAPAQSVVCGPVEQVTRLIEELGKEGTLCQPLPFSTGIHSRYVAPQVEQLRELVGDMKVRPGSVPVWSSTVAAPIQADVEQRRDLFFRHLTEPVRFRSTVTAMHDAGFRAFIQVGPGQLWALIEDNLRGKDHLAVPANVAFRSGLAQLQRVATALWVEGYAPDLAALNPARQPGPVRKATVASGRSLRMLLNLGATRFSLGEDARGLITAADFPGSAAPAGAGAAAGSAAIAKLKNVPGHPAVTAELAALLEDTADAAVTVLSAAGQRDGNGAAALPDAAELPDAAARASHLATDDEPVRKSVLRISLDTMPYLADHALHQLPAGWPHRADSMPVMPATTIIQHMIDAVEAAEPGMRATEVTDARFPSWTVADPPHEVDITVKRRTPGEFAVAFGSSVRATIRVADAYPANPPSVWQHDPATEQPPQISPERIYSTRLLFHGPSYRSVTDVHGVGERHIRGLLRAPAPPGGLLDGSMQLSASWAHLMLPTRNVYFPTSFGSLRLFGPVPAEGEMVECVIRVHTITESEFGYDVQYIHAGRVWAQLDDCMSRRFDYHPRARKVQLDPGHHPLAVRQPEGWVAVFDIWSDLAALNAFASLTLGAAGYRDYERQLPAHRKAWLLGRIAVKDAVRHLLWADGGPRPIFPIEIQVSDAADGRPLAQGWSGLAVPAYEISSAQAAHLGVAIARPAASGAVPGAPGVGIGVAEITDRPGSAPAAMADEELALLEAASRAGPGSGRALWSASFSAAREAAAKADGTTLTGPPGQVMVTGATPTVITVVASGRTYQVSHREVRDPAEASPARRHVVAWTWGPDSTVPR